MRKSLIALLVLAVLSVGGLVWATAAVNRQEEAVEITEERHYGDPAAGRGIQLRTRTTMDDRLHWDTVISLGPEITWNTDFRYSGYRDAIERESTSYFYLSAMGGVGSSTNYGGSLDLDDWDGDPFGPVMADVASRAPAGVQDYTEVVQLSDYMDYYPLGADYHYDDGENPWWPGEEGLWPGVTEFMRLPVDGLTATINISKNDQGGIYATGWEQMEMPDLETAAVCVDGGVWLAIWGGYDEDGVAQPMLEGAAETGVYWIPIKRGVPDEYGNTYARVDEDGVKLAWQPENGICVGVWSPDGGETLLAQVSTETGQEMAVLDTADMEVEQILPLDYDQNGWMELYVEEDHVVTMTSRNEEQSDGTYKTVRQWMEAWYRGADGKYEKTVSCDILPSGIEWNYELVTWCDEERLVVAALADGYLNPSVDVVVCDGDGLQYAARLNHSQGWDPNRMDPVYSADNLTVRSAQ